MALKFFGMTRVKHSIMLILGLLVGLFVLGMGLLSSLNLDVSQQALTELRQRQITDTFYANLDRINAHHLLMEKNTAGLARLGEQFLRMKNTTGGDNRRELEQALQRTLTDFPEANGGGIWYAPGAYTPDNYSAYGYRHGAQMIIQRDESGYHTQDWYARVLPPDGDSEKSAALPRFYWTPAYYKDRINDVVISLTTLMRDANERIVGLASTDWRVDEIIQLVSRVKVTPGTFSFLLDSENRNLSSLAAAEDVLLAQELMDAIAQSRLQEKIVRPQPQSAIISGRQLVSPMQTMTLSVRDQDYALYFSRTQAGMVFGVGVPRAEIDAILVPMRESNLRITLLVGSLVLLLSGLLLYLIAGTLKQLHTLYTDALTQLPNREKLLADLKPSQPATLILLNIDAFKEINDFYGHLCGDHVITAMARSLGQLLAQQSAWAGSRLYRMPADEMAIWLPGVRPPESLQQYIDALLAHVGKLGIKWQGQAIPLHVTLGLAATQAQDSAPADDGQLLISASIAMKLARQNKSSHLVYDPAHKVRESYEQNLLWANRLKRALAEGRIVPFFQPIMDIRSGRIRKFECLARMIDETGHAVSPGRFLTVAKKIRLYRQITRTMVQQSFSRFAESDYEFSLNLSLEDLLDPELTTFIVNSLSQGSLAKRVIFEILESEGIENYAAVKIFIDRVKALGCRIAIDDFGTGYSNFEHLLRLNVDMIKIDGSLIRLLDTDQNALTITRGIVDFAKGLGMQTVAEFVHSPALLKVVKALGIDYAQGACIGLPAATLVTEVELA
ncbi:MAG: EAL domain-containing protein [Gammaproteobacteria bacterium]|nr:EAL domain-containing protein [Rhodocyclaceae bacterium]MBU3909214.1 EAL domain-containing protein [Gammaproteobacteria bacterium]MBU3990154.1 EAL domain-containing protein [Gammaproteobacteria bacterium]MBU4005626.1 EAL domain-containing protein [Gammaproteobacteria bacterium]MBU4020821.1 EAL domain-containing protein [Gammaproteobacteria bacterium]